MGLLRKFRQWYRLTPNSSPLFYHHLFLLSDIVLSLLKKIQVKYRSAVMEF